MKDCGKWQKAFVCGGKKDLSLHCGTAGSEPGFESNVTMLLSDGRQIETHCGHLFTQFTCLRTFYRYCAKKALSISEAEADQLGFFHTFVYRRGLQFK